MTPAQLVAEAVWTAAENSPTPRRADLFDGLADCTAHLDESISSTARAAAAAIREAEASQLLLKQIIQPK